ncbi:O-antigen ligase family protein [Bacillus tianshenii]|nr:O-antigen ligase family protein [Bacillus tianshenii]
MRMNNWQVFVWCVFLVLGLFGGLLTYIHPMGILMVLFLLAGFFIFKNMPEIFIPMYVFSGLYKSIVPGPDSTVLFFGLALLAAVLKIYEKRERVFLKLREPHIIFISLFIFWIILSLTYTPSGSYAVTKAFKVMLMTVGAIILPIILVENKKQFSRILIMICTLGTIMTFISVTQNTREVFGSNYLALGFIGGLTTLILTFYFLPNGNKIFVIPLILINVLGIITSAARGAVLFTPFTLVTTILLSTQAGKGKLKSLAVLIGGFVFGILALYFYTPDTFKTISGRLNKLQGDSEEGTGTGREGHIQEAIELMENHLFTGVGIGGYGISLIGLDDRYFPHNIILEIGAELGVIGLLLFFFFLFALLIYFNKYRGKLLFIDNVVVSTVIFSFFNALKSNNLVDNRQLFVFFGLMAVARYIVESELSKKNESIDET